METVSVIALTAALVPLCGILAAITPFLMPRGECFAVTIPAAQHGHPVLRSYRKGYALCCLVFAAACTTACGVVAEAKHIGAPDADLAGYLISYTALVGLVVVVPFVWMLSYRKKVMRLKAEEGWSARADRKAAVVSEEDAPGAVSLAWNLLYVPVLLLIVAVGVVLYPSMPDMIPMHADSAGNVDVYAPKGVLTVFGFPVGLTVLLAVCMVSSQWVMRRSKRPVSPGAPAVSALAYGLFARAQSIFLLICGLILSAVIGVGFMLSSGGIITLGQMAVAVLVACAPIVIGSIALSVVYGQSGARLQMRLAAEGGQDDCLACDDDRHWKLGVFYWNPDDPALWLPERFGIGWTMNMARPAAWACVAGLALFVALSVALLTGIAGQ